MKFELYKHSVHPYEISLRTKRQTCILTNEIQEKYNWYVICFQCFILLQNQPEEGDKQDFFLTSGLCNESRLGAVELEDDFSVAVQLLRCFG